MRTNVHIRKARLEDSEQIGRVHYQSWLETYRGIMDDDYLDNISLQNRIDNVKNYYQVCQVAEINDEIVGIITCDSSRDDDLIDTLEIIGLYVLKAHHRNGIGKSLIEKCIEVNSRYTHVTLWVSKDNDNAIKAYKNIGFVEDGKHKVLTIGSKKLSVIRMMMKM